MTAFKENVKAVAEGATGAPKIEKAAIDPANVSAGANVVQKFERAFSGTYTDGLWTTYERLRVLKSGTFRFRANVGGTSGSNTMRSRWYNNTTAAVIVETIATGSNSGDTADVAVTAGDIIYFQGGMDSGGRADPDITGRIAVSDQDCVAGGYLFVDEDDDI